MLKRKKPITVPDIRHKVDWPDGLFVMVENGICWHITKGKRYKVFSDRALNSWHPLPISGSLISLAGHPYGGILGFRPGTVIEDLSSGIIYLISNNKRRKITNPDVLLMLGLPIVTVSKAEEDIHEDGESLDDL